MSTTQLPITESFENNDFVISVKHKGLGLPARLTLSLTMIGLLALPFAVSSFDFGEPNDIIELLFDLNREEGTTLVLVTHDMGLAQRCQRRLVLEAGSLVEG